MKNIASFEQIKEEVHSSLMQHLFHYYYTLLPYSNQEQVAKLIVDEINNAKLTFEKESKSEQLSFLSTLNKLKLNALNVEPTTVDEEIENQDLIKSLTTVIDFVEKENVDA